MYSKPVFYIVVINNNIIKNNIIIIAILNVLSLKTIPPALFAAP